MPGESSSKAAWFSLLDGAGSVSDGSAPVGAPVAYASGSESRPDDPRLGEIVEFWDGDLSALKPRRGVIVGFPQDEGVRRNRGRPGAAAAPNEIRRFLYQLTPWDGFRDIDLRTNAPLDVGNVRIEGTLEESQDALAKVVAGILADDAVPIVLGGGHETAFGHFLGYRKFFGQRPTGLYVCDENGKALFELLQRSRLINIDAHLDVRPCLKEGGHSGSPFRQAIEMGTDYVCLGAQPHCVSHEHLNYVKEHGGVVRWCEEVRGKLCQELAEHLVRPVYVSIDADVVQRADVPGVSAPNVCGLSGSEVLAAAFLAGQSAAVSSMDLVEINPSLDHDSQSSRWGALLIWNFLVGLATRNL